MAKIANLASINTFDTWRTRLNIGFDRLSQFAITNSSLYANTITANVAFTSTGLATLSGRATVGTNLTVSGNTSTNKATVTSALTVSGNTTLGAAGKTITTTGAAAHTGTQSISTNLTVSGNTAINGSTLSTTSVTLTALAGATTLLTLGGTGASAVLAIPSTLEQSSTTGALTVAGGVYIAKKLNVAGIATLGNGAVLGTPASGTVTNLTGTASININGTVGATTPAAGAFTTVSATGAVTISPTNGAAIATYVATNTGGSLYVGLDDSTGASFTGVAYASLLWRNQNKPLIVGVNNTTIANFSSTGLAVTGTLSSTTGANFATSSGNVGIGTSSPSVKLDVTGSIKASVSVTSASDFIGGGASGYAALYGDGAGGLVVCRGSSSTNDIEFSTNSTERMRIDSSGNVTLQKNISVGGAAPTTSGTGITFPATQSGSTNANTLDDYEEGTWTPNVNGASVGSFSTKTGYYVKIGKQVTCWFMCDGGSTGAGGATQYVTNLPFTITTAINNGIMGQMGVNGPATRTLDLMALNANFGVAYVYTGGSQEQTAISFASGCFTYGID